MPKGTASKGKSEIMMLRSYTSGFSHLFLLFLPFCLRGCYKRPLTWEFGVTAARAALTREIYVQVVEFPPNKKYGEVHEIRLLVDRGRIDPYRRVGA